VLLYELADCHHPARHILRLAQHHLHWLVHPASC
jgi:hypothetical protein